jgi:hypothetical protein
MFDASTGQRVVAEVVRNSDRAAVESLREHVASHPPRVVSAGTPTTTPTPSITPTSAEPTPTSTLPASRIDLTVENLPPSLEATFDAYPLWPGTWWVWRVTGRNAGVSWTGAVVTETVDAAWLVGPDEVLVRSTTETHVIADGAYDVGPEAFAHPTIWRHVAPDGVFPSADAENRQWPEPRTHEGVALELWSEPLGGWMGEQNLGRVSDPSVTVVAGNRRYEDCRLLEVVGGAQWGTFRWFCPGVGYTRTELYACSVTLNAYFELIELVDWSGAP